MASPRQVEPRDDRSLRAPGDPAGEQAAALTHDVNDLLTAILGHAQVALGEPGLPDGVRSDVEAIARAARQAALLTRRLVVLLRPDVGQRTEMDLRSVVDAMAAMLRPMIGDGIDLRVEHGGRPIRVVEDPVDLEAVILNLALNARDAMPDGGTLTFGSAILPGAGGRRAGIWVADTGCGMDAATRARAFEPYFTTKGPGRGTGLGLASVTTLVRRNAWTILVDSAPGQGSRFTVTIPLPARNPQPG